MSQLDDNGLFKDDAGKMTLASGKAVNPLALAPEDIDIEDIATSLSRQCRYNGHVGGFLSVARHCVWVAERIRWLLYPAEVQLAGLLHDAAEAYLGDMIRPLKYGTLGAGYLSVEAGIEAKIALRFGVTYPFHPAVGEADNWVLLEREIPGARWLWSSSPQSDHDEFIYLYDKLQEECA